ncbi:MAG: hypothetical protein KC646_05670 [Candidatus Cloacimonetes bacterium]|nr:hypothetical protein [Candidatus Cloacimonadota bacterium]
MNIPSLSSLSKAKTHCDVRKETIAYLCEFGSDVEKSMLKELIDQEQDQKLQNYYKSLTQVDEETTVEVLDSIHSSVKKITTSNFGHVKSKVPQNLSFSSLANLKRLFASCVVLLVFFSFGYKPIQDSMSLNSGTSKNMLNILSTDAKELVIKRQVHHSQGRKILALDMVVPSKDFDVKSVFSTILKKEKAHFWGIRVRFFNQGNLKSAHHHLFASQEVSPLMEDFANMYTSQEWIVVWDSK